MIDKRTLEVVLADQQEELAARAMDVLCSRKEEEWIDLQSTQAQVVIGVRRSGKSTLCYQALHHSGGKFAYVNFDDERLANLQVSQLNDVLEVLYIVYGDFDYLFLDEVQNIPGWHLFVNRLLRKKMHIVITGSNAKLLSGELATHLSGRNREITLFPFSFGEYCEMRRVDVQSRTTKSEAFRRAAFDDYLKQGGFPEMLTIGRNEQYVQHLLDNILKRDIEQRYKIVYKAAFEKLAQHLLNIVPTIVSVSDLCKVFSFKSVHTVKNYIDYLKQAYMLIGIQKYSPKSKLRVSAEKLYPMDVAMMDRRENAFAGENLGHRLEVVVLLHLLRRSKMKGYDVYFLNERGGECDFLVCDGNTVKQAIQVSYDIAAEKTRKREIRGLLLAARLTHCSDLLLLTDHEYEDVEEQGHVVHIRPVYDWCLKG